MCNPRALVLAVLLGGVEVRADVFRVLDDPREAMQARVDLIQQAKHEINALYFLTRNDRISLTALALLRDARRRGVGSVRLIVDAGSHRIPKAVLVHLRDEGVEVRVYHPFTLRHPRWMLRRMHEKVVVVDGERYIAGGRNLAESYFGMAAKKNYVDRDVYVEGPSAVDADRHFETLWSSRHVASLKVRVTLAERNEAANILDRRSQNLDSEVICVAEDEALAQELLESIDLHLQNAWTVRGNGRPLRAHRDPEVSRAKSFRAWAARFLLPIVEGQL